MNCSGTTFNPYLQFIAKSSSPAGASPSEWVEMVYWADGPLGLRLARLVNDAMAEAARAHPGRFVGLATLPLQDPYAALAEVERAITELGCRGVYLGTNVRGKDLDDPDFLPVFARIAALGVPAFPAAHLLVFWGGVQQGFDGFRHDPAEYAARVAVPTLLLHGGRDDRVTTAEARTVFDRLRGRKVFVTFPDAKHGSLLKADPARWRSAVVGFLGTLRGPLRRSFE